MHYAHRYSATLMLAGNKPEKSGVAAKRVLDWAVSTTERGSKMSQATQIYLVDDVDGSETDVATVRFSLDGTNYEIDLNAAHAADLRTTLEPFVVHARRIARNGQPRTRSLSARARTARIRAWAKGHGYEISELGRIPDTVLAAYENAH